MSTLNIPASFITNDEQKILNCYPFFGGTTPTTDTTVTETPPATETKTTETKTATTTTDEDPIKKLQSDPTALQQLLDQVSKATGDLAKVTKDRDTLATEKDKAARAQLTKEENLQKDLENAQLQIESQHEVIVAMAKQNAFLTSSGDVQWNSIKQAMAELDENNFSVEVDLESRTANVENMNNEVKRIAKDFPWLVKSAANPDGNGTGSGRGPGRPPGTGAPPAPQRTGQPNKQRRDAMMNRFPVLMQNR